MPYVATKLVEIINTKDGDVKLERVANFNKTQLDQ